VLSDASPIAPCWGRDPRLPSRYAFHPACPPSWHWTPPTQQAPLPPRADEAPAASGPRLVITVVEGPREGQGDVTVEGPEGKRLARLSGRPWQVFEYLWRNRGRFVQAEEIGEGVGIPTTPRGMRSSGWAGSWRQRDSAR